MFTGIISAIGMTVAVDMRNQSEYRLRLRPLASRNGDSYADVALGESIAVNGVCLTVASIERSPEGLMLAFDVSRETCARSNLGALVAGEQVNLERALRLSDRLSGHLVQGHVDGVGRLARADRAGECRELEIQLPGALAELVVEKGSIALDGISLTINSIKNSAISVMVIPHTWANTALSSKKPGQDFNVELDVIAKYVQKLVKTHA